MEQLANITFLFLFLRRLNLYWRMYLIYKQFCALTPKIDLFFKLFLKILYIKVLQEILKDN